jgi:5'-3' exonuclease
MGIKNLTKFIKDKKYKNAYVTKELGSFAFEKIAIDTPVYMHKYKSINAVKMVEGDGLSGPGKGRYYNPDAWLWSFIHLIYSLRKYDVHPVFILEGGCPPEKNKTREARKKDREDVKKKTVSLEESISLFESSGQFDDPPSDLQEEWNKIAKKKNLPFGDFDFDSVKEQVRQRHRYDMTIRSRDYEKLKILLDIMKTPYLQAPMEAEALCAFLYKEGIVHGIASNDSDILAYGCNLIVDFQFSNDDSKVVYIDHSILLNLLNINKHEFLDFCIMCGTDYNDNIYKIGTVRSHELIKTHKSIEGVDKFLDPTGHKGTILILNHKRVREIFNNYGFSKFVDYNDKMAHLKEQACWSGVPDFHLLCLFGMRINLSIDFDWIKDAFERCNVEWEDDVEEGKDNDVIEIVDDDEVVDDYFPIF